MENDVEKIYRINKLFCDIKKEKSNKFSEKVIENFVEIAITRDEIVQQIYQMLKDIDKLFELNKIQYWLSGGTLLGAIRHKGLIPWDDDADIEVLEDELDKLLSINYENYGYEIAQTYFGYKIFPISGSRIKKFNWKYPFLDIFVVKIKNGRTSFISKRAQFLYKLCTFSENELFPLKKYKFGSLNLYGPKETNQYFSKCYGNDWFTHYYKSYDHEQEKEMKYKKSRLLDYSPVLPLGPLNELKI
jgi:lipopolysaccharide cholinephosphotransferase